MFKIGFIGNSCTGKTTAAFSLITELKKKRCLTAYTADACRFITFPPSKLDTDPNARLQVLFQHMANECEQMVRDDADYLIVERTAADWLLYYTWTCQQEIDGVVPKLGSGPQVMEKMVWEWMKTYDLLFLMRSEGMVYVNDGFRPATTKIRDQVEDIYRWLFSILPSQVDCPLVEISGDSLEARLQAVHQGFGKWLSQGNFVVRPTRIPTYQPEHQEDEGRDVPTD